MFPIQQTPPERTAKPPHVRAQSEVISQPWCGTFPADSVVTPADERTHCRHLGDEGLVHICIKPIFSPVSDPTRCLQY